MTPATFRDRLETLLGPVNTITRAAAALGCDRRSVYRWLDPEDPAPVPEWAVRHVETVEAVRTIGRLDVVPYWRERPPPP